MPLPIDTSLFVQTRKIWESTSAEKWAVLVPFIVNQAPLLGMCLSFASPFVANCSSGYTLSIMQARRRGS
jgi:hypothetical protein